MPSYNNNIPIVINIDDIFVNIFNLFLFSTTSKSREVSYGDNSLTITQNDNDESEGSREDVPWTMAMSGELMTTRNSTCHLLTVSTAGRPKGMYVVNVTVGKEVMTGKVAVNSMNGGGS